MYASWYNIKQLSRTRYLVIIRTVTGNQLQTLSLCKLHIALTSRHVIITQPLLKRCDKSLVK